MIPAMADVATRTIQAIRTAPNPSDHVDLIASGFQSFGQLLKRHPGYFRRPQQPAGADAAALLDTACRTLHLPETQAVKYSCSYASNLASAAALSRSWSEDSPR